MSEAPTAELPVIDPRHAPFTRDLSTLVVAIGLVAAVNLIALGVLIEAVRNTSVVGLSENATQVLTGALGGMIGILGSQLGYRAGRAQNGGPS
jgi:hypothetical protein